MVRQFFRVVVIKVLIWGVVLSPRLRTLVRIATDCAETGKLSEGYTAVSRTWSIWGGVVTLLPIVILILMVLNPGL